jgi:hypothetical protein
MQGPPTIAMLIDEVAVPAVERFFRFTVNAVLYDFHSRTLVERGCTAAVRDRVIEFNSRLIPDKRLIAYRILLMGHKTGFKLSAPVFHFVKYKLDLETLTALQGLFRAKVGKAGADVIMGEYNKLCRYPSHHAYCVGYHHRTDRSVRLSHPER